MKKKDMKKLVLSKETLVQLNGRDLQALVGGEGWSDQSVCPTTTPSDCRACY
jgi:hypothetical protein